MDILIAAQGGSLQGVCDALEAGVPVDTTDKYGETALIKASLNGHVNVVEKLVAAGANLNHQDKEGWTALICASQNGHDNVVEKLMAAGADYDHQNMFGNTALMCASVNGHVNVVVKLLTTGANLDLQENEAANADDEAMAKAIGRIETIVSDKDFKKALQEAGNKLVVVEFFDDGCPPSKAMGNKYFQLSEVHRDAIFLKVNTLGDCQGTIQDNRIRLTPVYVLFTNRKEISRVEGADGNELEAKILKSSKTTASEFVVPPGQMDLSILLDHGQCECSNDNSCHPFTNALKSGAEYCESDCDEQLIIRLPFKTPVKLHSVQLIGPDDGRAPKSVKLFINQPQILSFDDAEHGAAQQEFEGLDNDGVLSLHCIKFQSVYSLTIFVKDNHSTSGEETTVVNRIGLFGRPKDDQLAKNVMTKEDSPTRGVTPVGPPKITQHPNSQSVATGAYMIFAVEATGNNLQFQWQKDGADIDRNDPRFFSHQTDSTSTLQIRHVQESDKGHYRCLVKNPVEKSGKPSQEAKLSVFDFPQITQHPKSQSVSTGADITFTVEATGNNLQFQWQKDGADIDSNDPRFSSLWTHSTSTLRIRHVQESDKGRYRCVVTNPVEKSGIPSQEAKLTVGLELNVRNILNVLHKAKFADAHWELLGMQLIDHQAILYIKANCHGDPSHCMIDTIDQWLRTDIKASWEKLAVATVERYGEATANIVRQEAGIAHGPQRRMATDSGGPPMITQHPKHQKVPPGADITFDVEATGDDLQFQWQKDRAVIDSNDPRFSSSQTDGTSTLQIQRVKESDKGHYRCLVKNPVEQSGIPSQEAKLTVEGPSEPKFANSERRSVRNQFDPVTLHIQQTDETTMKAVQLFARQVVVILHTCNANEYWAALERMEPPTTQDGSKIRDRAINYPQFGSVIGWFAGYRAAVVRTGQGNKCRDELMIALTRSFPNSWVIIGAGIGYANNRKRKFADVLISDQIENFVQYKKEGDEITNHGPREEIDPNVLRVFENPAKHWTEMQCFTCTDDDRTSVAHIGCIVSAPTLVRDELLRDQLMKHTPYAIGGEMEGWILLELKGTLRFQHNKDIEFIVIKGVADYGDLKMGDEWQWTAAKAAMDCIHYCLERTGGIEFNAIDIQTREAQYVPTEKATDASSGADNVGHPLSGKELLALKDYILPKDVIESLQREGLDLNTIGNVQTTIEEVQRLLDSLGQSEIASSLRQSLDTALENQSHYEAYQRALQEGAAIPLKYLKVLFFGPPRTGKTSMRRRLVGEIQNLANEPVQASTGTAEVHEVIVKKVTISTAVIKKSTETTTEYKWSSVKVLCGKEKSNHETDLDEELQILYQFICGTIEVRSPVPNEEGPQEHTTKRPSLARVKKESPTQAHLPPKTDNQVASDSQEVLSVGGRGDRLSHKHMKEIEEAFEAFNKILRTAGQEQLQDLLEDWLDRTILMNMVDTGGQPAFLEMLPALTIGPALYLIFFRLDQELKQSYEVQYGRDNKNVLLDDSYTNEQVIFQALSSIACFNCTTPIKEGMPNPSHAAVLIGTYKDQLRGDPETVKTKIEEKDKKLKETLPEILKCDLRSSEKFLKSYSEDQLMFAVDNMNGGEEELTEVHKRLEKVIQRMYKLDNKWKIPASWLMFSIFIRKMNKRTLSLSQCREIGARLNMRDTDEALWFLHHYVGILMHFSDVSEIKDIVICDPQVVFDSVTSLIMDSFTFDNMEERAEKFRKTGQFRYTDIENIAVDPKRDSLSPQQLVGLLEHLNIIAPLRCHLPQSNTPTPGLSPQSDAHQEQIYFMPAVLKHAKEEELHMEHSSTDLVPLIIRFTCGFVPVGVFCAMIASLVTQEDTLGWELLEPSEHDHHILCKNKVTFRMDFAYDITLVSRPKWYEIHVICDPESTPFKTSGQVSQEVVDTVCDTLDKVISKMRYERLTSFHSNETLYELGFKCSKHPNDDHLVINRPVPMKGVKASSQSAKFLWLNYSEKKSIMFCLGKGIAIALPSSAQYLDWFEKPTEPPKKEMEKEKRQERERKYKERDKKREGERDTERRKKEHKHKHHRSHTKSHKHKQSRSTSVYSGSEDEGASQARRKSHKHSRKCIPHSPSSDSSHSSESERDTKRKKYKKVSSGSEDEGASRARRKSHKHSQKCKPHSPSSDSSHSSESEHDTKRKKHRKKSKKKYHYSSSSSDSEGERRSSHLAKHKEGHPSPLFKKHKAAKMSPAPSVSIPGNETEETDCCTAKMELNDRNILNVLHEAGFADAHWELLGMQLIKRPALLNIQSNRRGNPNHCMIDTISQWLMTDLEASWEKLAAAVAKVAEYGEATADTVRREAGIVTSLSGV